MSCSIANGFVIYKNYDKSFCYKIIIVLSVIVVLLSLWNWDLHIGTRILDWYYGVKFKSFDEFAEKINNKNFVFEIGG